MKRPAKTRPSQALDKIRKILGHEDLLELRHLRAVHRDLLRRLGEQANEQRRLANQHQFDMPHDVYDELYSSLRE